MPLDPVLVEFIDESPPVPEPALYDISGDGDEFGEIMTPREGLLIIPRIIDDEALYGVSSITYDPDGGPDERGEWIEWVDYAEFVSDTHPDMPSSGNHTSYIRSFWYPDEQAFVMFARTHGPSGSSVGEIVWLRRFTYDLDGNLTAGVLTYRAYPASDRHETWVQPLNGTSSTEFVGLSTGNGILTSPPPEGPGSTYDPSWRVYHYNLGSGATSASSDIPARTFTPTSGDHFNDNTRVWVGDWHLPTGVGFLGWAETGGSTRNWMRLHTDGFALTVTDLGAVGTAPPYPYGELFFSAELGPGVGDISPSTINDGNATSVALTATGANTFPLLEVIEDYGGDPADDEYTFDRPQGFGNDAEFEISTAIFINPANSSTWHYIRRAFSYPDLTELFAAWRGPGLPLNARASPAGINRHWIRYNGATIQLFTFPYVPPAQPGEWTVGTILWPRPLA